MEQADAGRRFQRLEPLPEVFALSTAETGASPLHRRLVFVALPEDAQTAALRTALDGRDGIRLAASRLFATGMEAPWHMFQVPSDVGLAPLLRWTEFLALQRQLADDLLLPACHSADVLVDWTPEHGDPRSVATICALFPDALVIADEAVASALPAGLRPRVLVYADADATIAAIDELVRAAPAPRPRPAAALPSAGPLQDRLVVVLGCGRSGTTWLQQLWLAHDRVAGLAGNETWLFHQLRFLWRAFDEGTGFGAWTDRESFVAALRRYCDGVLGAIRERFGSADDDYVVEKTPVHVHQLARIAEVYPDAWVVHLVRDGRQVARSISQVPFFGIPDVGDAAAVWARAVTAVRTDQHLVPRFRDVRYEDLVRDPTGTMRGLWSWVGLDAPATDGPGFGSAVHTPVSTHRRGGADAEPTAADLAAIHRRAGRTLVREGYLSRRALWRARVTRRGTA